LLSKARHSKGIAVTATVKSVKSYFEMLVEAALLCGHYRVLCDLYAAERFSKSLNNAGNEACNALVALARYCRRHGLDARTSPLYQCFGGLSGWYEERFERRRVVVCKDLSPQAIYQAIDKGNTLHWRDWTISTSNKDLMDDAYGLPKWDCVVTAKNASGETFQDGEDGHCRRARDLYEKITGYVYEGDDGLGRDSPHIYERGYDADDDTYF
jgi:hypothetical protein